MDSDHQEEEVKLTLERTEDLVKLLAYLGEPLRFSKQKNVYYDTVDRALHLKGAMLRVRQVGDRACVTAKSNAVLEAGTLRCREIEREVSVEEWQSKVGEGLENWSIPPIEHVRSFLSGAAPFVSLGECINERRYFSFEETYVLEVDRTQLPNGSIHVELELETDELQRHREMLEEMLKTLGIPYTDEVVPKVQRFLNALSSD